LARDDLQTCEFAGLYFKTVKHLYQLLQ
jgi:hypothetical protein